MTIKRHSKLTLAIACLGALTTATLAQAYTPCYPPNNHPPPVSMTNNVLEHGTCASWFNIIQFDERPNKVLRLTWTNTSSNNPKPVVAYAMGLSSSGIPVCDITARGRAFNRAFSSDTSPGACNAAAVWAFDAHT